MSSTYVALHCAECDRKICDVNPPLPAVSVLCTRCRDMAGNRLIGHQPDVFATDYLGPEQ